jgi:hypothetical protein
MEEIQTLAEPKLEVLQEKRSLLMKDPDKFKMLIDNLNKHLVDVDCRAPNEFFLDVMLPERDLRMVTNRAGRLNSSVASLVSACAATI